MSDTTSSATEVTAVITAQNTFTPWLSLDSNESALVTAKGTTFTGTVTVQIRRHDQTILDVINTAGVTNHPVADDYVETFEAPAGCDIRVGSKTGQFTGTSVSCSIQKG